jgi:DNA-binding response OmpR family regulator
MKILIVEDEADLLSAAKTYLNSEGFVCEGVATFEEALIRLRSFSYDCVVADIGLPDGNGLQLITELKDKLSETGVIIISARKSLEDKLEGLETGADDYLTKPFHLSELNARVKSILRRRKFNGSRDIVYNEICVLPDQQKVTVSGTPVPLTRKEFDLLIFFIANRNKVLTKESIVSHLWGDYSASNDSSDFIYTHVSNLRKKLLERDARDYITTVYGVGYKFSDE